MSDATEQQSSQSSGEYPVAKRASITSVQLTSIELATHSVTQCWTQEHICYKYSFCHICPKLACYVLSSTTDPKTQPYFIQDGEEKYSNIRGASKVTQGDFDGISIKKVPTIEILGVDPLQSVVFKEIKEIGIEVFERSCVKFSRVASILMSDCTDAQKLKEFNTLTGDYIVDEEKQISKWFMQKMRPYLKVHGYEVREQCIRSEFSKFGDAIVDFEVFVNDSHTSNKPSSAIVSLVECEVYTQIVEFKNQSINNDKWIYQTFANMVKAGTDRAMAAIYSGQIVKRVIVFGLLASIDLKIATPLKYSIDFNAGKSTFEVADSDNEFFEAFVRLLQRISCA